MKKIFVLIFLPISFFAQEKSFFAKRVGLALDVAKTSLKTVPSDFTYMGKSISNDWKKTAIYAGAIGGLILMDKPITQFYQEHIESNIKYELPDISINNNTFPWISGNDAYMFYSMSGLYVGSLFGGYEKGQYAALNGFKALTYSIAITHILLKTAFGRSRPLVSLKNGTSNIEHTTDNPFDFFNDRGGVYVMSGRKGSAFPSLHATAFFAMAKVFQMEFDNYWIPYGITAIVFSAEIKEHRHWVSDLVAGGIIGTLIGRSVVKSSWRARGLLPDKKKEVVFNCIPTVSSGYNGLQLVATF